MTKVVFKYQLPFDGKVSMPTDAQILRVDEQNGDICIWALVDQNTPSRTRSFTVLTTGERTECADALSYLNTVFMNGGIVLHVFECVLSGCIS